MRLAVTDIQSIKMCAERHFGADCIVRLFGSRIDDAKKGGDIDVHIEVHDDALVAAARRVDYLTDLEKEIGERKVDLGVEGPARKNGFIDRVARDTGVVL